PCGGTTHTGIDAALAIREEIGARTADIASIRAGISKYAQSRVGTQYPASPEAAKFNLQYVVASALLRGAPTLESFAPESIDDDRVKALARLITVAVVQDDAD